MLTSCVTQWFCRPTKRAEKCTSLPITFMDTFLVIVGLAYSIYGVCNAVKITVECLSNISLSIQKNTRLWYNKFNSLLLYSLFFSWIKLLVVSQRAPKKDRYHQLSPDHLFLSLSNVKLTIAHFQLTFPSSNLFLSLSLWSVFYGRGL